MRGGSTVYQYKSTHGIGVGSRNCITKLALTLKSSFEKMEDVQKVVDTLYFVKIIELIMYF